MRRTKGRRDRSRSPSYSRRRSRSRPSGWRNRWCSPSLSDWDTRSSSPSSDWSPSSRSTSRSRSPSRSSPMSTGRRRSPSRSGRNRSRSPTPRHQNGHLGDEEDQDRRVRDRSPDNGRRRSGRSRSPSHRRSDLRMGRSRSRSPGRGRAPRSCRSRSRTRSYECEDRRCCKPRHGDDDPDEEEQEYMSQEEEEDVIVRIDGSDRLFTCAQCYNLLSAPVYECAEGHVTCSSCHASTQGNEDGAPPCSQCGERNYRRTRATEVWLSSIRFPCRNYNHGCPVYRQRHAIEAHERTCLYAPCFCPVRRCEFPGGGGGELERHLTTDHGWHRVAFRYGQPFSLRISDRSVLRAEDDGEIFHLKAKSSKRGRATAMSMVWIRPDNVAAGGAEFTYEVRTPAAVEGVPQRLQMQATVWGTSLEYGRGRADADQVCVTVPDFMIPRDGPDADIVEVRVHKIEPAAARNEN